MNINPDNYLNIREFAAQYERQTGKVGASLTYIQRLVKQGRLDTIELGGKTYINKYSKPDVRRRVTKKLWKPPSHTTAESKNW